MREARDPDVWRFVTPRAVWQRLDAVRPYVGLRRGAVRNFVRDLAPRTRRLTKPMENE